MYFLRIVRPDYHKRGFMQKCLEISEVVALDSDFKRITDLARLYPCIRADVFEIAIEPDRTTSLESGHNTLVFRLEDGWHRAYRRVRLMGFKDHGPPYSDELWISESHRHLLIEYQI